MWSARFLSFAAVEVSWADQRTLLFSRRVPAACSRPIAMHTSCRFSAPARPLSRRAFTLIELLTVIAIIGILAAIIIPTVGKVRATARKAQCVSKLREWGTAVRLISNDYKGLVPLSQDLGTGTVIYSPYFSQKTMLLPDGSVKSSQELMSRCPTATSDSTDTTLFMRRCYGFGRPSDTPWNKHNLNMFGSTVDKPITAYNIGHAATPSRQLLMIELAPGNDGALVDNGDQLATKARPIQIDNAKQRHGGVANVLFLDGHVETLSAAKTDYSGDNVATIDRWFKLK